MHRVETVKGGGYFMQQAKFLKQIRIAKWRIC
jgi:hypothetical protein